MTLLEAKTSVSINNQLLRDGVLRVMDRPPVGLDNKLVNEMRQNQERAKLDNLGVWEWGDVSDSEGEESRRYDGRVPRRKFK